jgi:hypothetical protein
MVVTVREYVVQHMYVVSLNFGLDTGHCTDLESGIGIYVGLNTAQKTGIDTDPMDINTVFSWYSGIEA